MARVHDTVTVPVEMFSVGTVGEYTVEMALTATEQVYAAHAPGMAVASAIDRAAVRRRETRVFIITPEAHRGT
jgi:hypothetical protein